MLYIGLLCRVYNFTPIECLKLKCRQFRLFAAEAVKQRARLQLEGIEVVSFPKLEDAARKQLQRRLQLTTKFGLRAEEVLVEEGWQQSRMLAAGMR